MGVTIHYDDGTTKKVSEDDASNDGHDHDAVHVEGQFGNFYRCTDCGLEAIESQLQHVTCE